jgi:lipopolysaccharide transport system ATP-binding protein
MEDVAKGGRTVIFVSHNTGVLLNLCPKCILLENGAKIKEGPSPEVIAEYIKVGSQSVGEVSWELTDPRAGNDNLRLHQARILCQGEVTGEVSINREVILQFDFDVLRNDLLVSSSIHLHDKQGVWVLCSGTATSQLARGMHQHEYVFPANFFNDGLYTLTLFLITKVTQIEVCVRDAISFTVHETGFGREEYGGAIGGCVRPLLLTKEKVLTQLAEP